MLPIGEIKKIRDMVRKIFNSLNQGISGLHQTAYLLGFFTLLSQILALLRDRLLAHSFGAGEILDIYYASFRIPDFIFITVASIVSLSVLVPYLTEEISKNRGKQFVNEIFSIFSLLIVLACSLAFFLIPKMTSMILPGFSPEAISQVIILSRVLLLSPILLGLSNFFASIIQIKQKFFIYALSPLFYNVGIIIGILLFYPLWGIKGLVYGVILGAFFHLIVQLPSIYRLRFIPKITLRPNFSGIKKIIILSLPRTLALSSGNIAIMFLVGLASSMGEGSISIFNFSYSLQSVPLSIIGVSYSIAAFPALAKLFSDKQFDEFFQQIVIATRHILFWAVAISALFIVLRAQIVRIILGSGKFDWVDTRLTAACLAAFAVSIAAQSLVLLFVRGYYAAGKTAKPVLFGVFSSVCVVVSAFLFRWLVINVDFLREWAGLVFRVEDINNMIVLILPISYSLGMLINASLLWFSFQKDFNPFPSELGKSFFQILIASVVMAVATYISLNIWNNVFNINTFLGIFFQGLLAGMGGLLALILTLKLLKNKELSEIHSTLKQKFCSDKP